MFHSMDVWIAIKRVRVSTGVKCWHKHNQWAYVSLIQNENNVCSDSSHTQSRELAYSHFSVSLDTQYPNFNTKNEFWNWVYYFLKKLVYYQFPPLPTLPSLFPLPPLPPSPPALLFPPLSSLPETHPYELNCCCWCCCCSAAFYIYCALNVYEYIHNLFWQMFDNSWKQRKADAQWSEWIYLLNTHLEKVSCSILKISQSSMKLKSWASTIH